MQLVQPCLTTFLCVPYLICKGSENSYKLITQDNQMKRKEKIVMKSLKHLVGKMVGMQVRGKWGY